MTEMLDRRIFELVSRLISDESSPCEDREIFEYFFFPISESWSLDPEDGEDSFEFIQNNPSERLSIDIVSDDDEFTTTRSCERFQYSEDIFQT